MTAAFLIYIVVVILIASVAILLIKKAPFIDQQLKDFGAYAIGAIAIVIVIVKLLQVLPV